MHVWITQRYFPDEPIYRTVVYERDFSARPLVTLVRECVKASQRGVSSVKIDNDDPNKWRH